MTGKQISTIRKKFDFTALMLSELLGVQVSTVYRWESRGAKKLNIEGIPGKLLPIMLDMTPEQVKSVSSIYEKKGWMGGLHRALDIAYKNI